MGISLPDLSWIDDRFDEVGCHWRDDGLEVFAMVEGRTLRELLDTATLDDTHDASALVREALDRLHHCFKHTGGTDG